MRCWLLVFIFSLLLESCADPPLLQLEIATPKGPDPIASSDRLRLIVTDPPLDEIIRLEDPLHFSHAITANVNSATGSIIVETYQENNLIARGETPSLVLQPRERQLRLFVGKAGAINTLPMPLPMPASDLLSVLLPSKGILLLGGIGHNKSASQQAVIYDYLLHQTQDVAPLPEARVGAVGAACGGTCGAIALGSKGNDLATQILRFNGGAWESFADELPTIERRRDAGMAASGDGAYWIIGGEGNYGSLASVLKFSPGTSLEQPKLEVTSNRLAAARKHPSIIATNNFILVAGGQALDQEPFLELFIAKTMSPISLNVSKLNAPVSGCGTIDLEDGRFMVVGGRTSTGELSADAWIVNPANGEVSRISKVLKQGRVDHIVKRVYEQLLIIGGKVENGITNTVEVLDAKTFAQVSVLNMEAPRTSFIVEHLGAGNVFIAGGMNDGGDNLLLEVYETSHPMSLK